MVKRLIERKKFAGIIDKEEYERLKKSTKEIRKELSEGIRKRSLKFNRFRNDSIENSFGVIRDERSLKDARENIRRTREKSSRDLEERRKKFRR